MTLKMRAIGSTEDLLSVADAIGRESATRYRKLAALALGRDNAALAAEFDGLAELETRRVEKIAKRARSALGGRIFPAPSGPGMPRIYDEDEARDALAGPYQALSFAVRNAERSFAFYTYIAANAEKDEVRALAEDLARGQLESASNLRRLRRRAYRTERPAAIEIPADVAGLRNAARQWESRAALAHASLADRLAKAGEHESAAIFRRVAAEEQAAGGPAAADKPPAIRTVADGARLLEETFDRLALIGERAKDQEVVSEAQRLAQIVVARLALVGAASGASLADGRGV